jgi:hypothetical protein
MWLATHVQEQITEIQNNKRAHNTKKREKIKFKLSLDLSFKGFDSVYRFLNSASEDVRSLSNFKISFSQFKKMVRAFRSVEKRHMKEFYIGEKLISQLLSILFEFSNMEHSDLWSTSQWREVRINDI